MDLEVYDSKAEAEKNKRWVKKISDLKENNLIEKKFGSIIYDKDIREEEIELLETL